MDHDVLASAERRICELEAEVATLKADRDWLLSGREEAKAEILRLEVENRLAMAVGSVNQSLKDALDHNGQQYDAIRDQLAADERRIQDLEAQVTTWREKYHLLAAAVNEHDLPCDPECDRYGHTETCASCSMAKSLEAAQRRIQELEAELLEKKCDIKELGQDYAIEVESLLDYIDSACSEIHQWMEYAGVLRSQYTRQIRYTLERLMDKSGRVSHGNTNVIELFDAAVAQVRGEKTDD